MGILTEVWVADIQANLFEGMEHVGKSVNHNGFVRDKVVHVPQAGAVPAIQVNRTVVPAVISKRTDTDLTYTLDDFTIDPILVQDLEDIQTSYDKRQSVLSEQMAVLNERIGDEALFAWAPSAAAETERIFRTTGATTAQLPHTTATGTRKLITKEDFALGAARLDKDKLPKQGRWAMMPTSMYYELFEIDELVRKDFGQVAQLSDGSVNMLFSVKIMQRNTVVIYDDDTVPVKRAIGAAEATDDNLAVLIWSQFAVAAATGSIKVFAEEDKAAYYGSLFSAEVLHKASKLRSDNKGRVAIVQGA